MMGGLPRRTNQAALRSVAQRRAARASNALGRSASDRGSTGTGTTPVSERERDRELDETPALISVDDPCADVAPPASSSRIVSRRVSPLSARLTRDDPEQD